mgnify:FL=1
MDAGAADGWLFRINVVRTALFLCAGRTTGHEQGQTGPLARNFLKIVEWSEKKKCEQWCIKYGLRTAVTIKSKLYQRHIIT